MTGLQEASHTIDRMVYLYIIPITRYSRVEFNFAVDTLRMSGYTAHGQYGH